MKKFTTVLLTAILVLTASILTATAQTTQNNQTTNSGAENNALNFGIPENDVFATPTVLTLNGNSVSTAGSTDGTSKEAGEPNHAGNAGGRSVWYSYTPQATTVARIKTINQGFDSLLAVYTGTVVNNLTAVGSNDDCYENCVEGSSMVDLMLVGGQTYRIAIDGYNDGTTISSGVFTLEITALNAPAQDNLANAHNLGTRFSGSIAGTNHNATSQAGEPNHNGVPKKSVWYRWTPNRNFSVDFELTENFNSVINIYRSPVANPTFAQLEEVAENLDFNDSNNTRYRTTFRATSGATYYISIDGSTPNALNSGNFQLKFYTHHFRYSNRLSVREQSHLSVFRPSNGTWYNYFQYSGGATSYKVFGANGDVPVAADYDGDGLTDYAVTRSVGGNKIWHVQSTRNAILSFTLQWGLASDKAVTGDFDNDGIADLTAIRKVQNSLIWYVRQSSDNTLRIFNWGAHSDEPVIGDFDGDGATDLAVTRQQAGKLVWYILKSGYGTANPTYTQSIAAQFGSDSNMPAPEDYDGDRKTDIAVFRGEFGTWYILRSSDNQVESHRLGQTGDHPQPADYNGDGKAEAAVYRPIDGTWYTSPNPGTNYGAIKWGAEDDIPVSSMSALFD